jgi:polysaccharide biosynthesis protein PslJ
VTPPRLTVWETRRGPLVSLGVVTGATASLALTVLTRLSPQRTAPVLAMAIVLVVWQRQLLAWRALLTGILIVVFFIPIRRYTVPGNLPFQLEPYRLAVALVLAGWFAALLVDPRVRWRKSGLEAPLLTFAAAALASVLVNWSSRVRALGVEPNTIKSLTFLISFLLVVFLIVSLTRTARDLDFLVRVLVGCGTVLAGFAMLEAISGYNIFNHLSGTLSFLRSEPLPFTLSNALANDRGGRLRVYASAQDPIALSAVLVMLVPLAVYLACTTPRRALWGGCAGLLVLGAVAPLSRTGIVMLVVVAGVFVWLRPRQTRRLWPALVPALLVIHLALPGSLGALESAFLPAGGLIAQQQSGAGTGGSGRLADVGPSISEWSRAPILGEGYGTRVVDGLTPNAPILDDEWLGLLLETGLAGVLAWLWVYGRVLRRLVAGARADGSRHGLLCTALTASIASYAIGMFTYDSFSFIQVTLVLFFLLGMSAAVGIIHAREGTPAAAR